MQLTIGLSLEKTAAAAARITTTPAATVEKTEPTGTAELLDRDFELKPFLLALLKEQIEAYYDSKTLWPAASLERRRALSGRPA